VPGTWELPNKTLVKLKRVNVFLTLWLHTLFSLVFLAIYSQDILPFETIPPCPSNPSFCGKQMLLCLHPLNKKLSPSFCLEQIKLSVKDTISSALL
jgi:hypothetical protein